MTELFEGEVLTTALIVGISYDDYWNYSNREIKLIFDAYAEGQKKALKQTVQNNYSLAQMTASFVGIVFSNKQKKIPTIYELYPDLFEQEAKQAK